MEIKKLEVEVSAGADLFFAKLENFCLALDKALEDDWKLEDDLPIILSSALSELVPAMSAFKGMTDDFSEAPMMAAKSGIVHVLNIVNAFMTKPA